jgi:hypothetical protein
MIELLEDQNTSPLLREKTEATLRIVSVGNARFVLSGSSTSSPEARDALVRVLVDLATKSTVDRDYMAMASMQDNVKSRELVARAFAQMTKMESPPDQVIRSLIVLRQDKNQTVRTIAADSLAKNIGPKSSHYSQVKAALAAPVESEVSVAKSTKLPVPGAPLAQPPAAVAEEAGD